jgi:hypothetical protein
MAIAVVFCTLARPARAQDRTATADGTAAAEAAPAPDPCDEDAPEGPSPNDALRRLLRHSSCEETAGRLVEAARDAEAAAKLARRRRAAAVERAVRGRIAALGARTPRLTVALPSDVDDLKVTLDRQPQRGAALGAGLPIDPGRHALHAEATRRGLPVAFDRTFSIDERERIDVAVTFPASTGPSDAPPPPDRSETVSPAASPPASSVHASSVSPVNVRVALESSGYSDSNRVNVFSPTVNGSVASPTEGWNVGGSYTVDFVSAASPDIVSEASPPFHEIRHAGTLSGGYKPALFGVQATAEVSREPDYLSMGGGLALTVDLNDKLVTPRFAVHYSHDTIGRSTTPFSVFHHTLDSAEIEAATTFVLSPRSVLLVGGTLDIERGDQSKPYRYVPMFDPITAARVRPGQSIASVNSARMSIRPLEQLPTARERYALGFRFVHRFPPATLRLEERVYVDSWRQVATTTDARLMIDLGPRLRVWPHGRLNAQGAVDFYRLAYTASVDATNNAATVPTYRTGDRELGPMVTATGGAGARVLLTAPSSSPALAFTLQVDAIYSRFFQSLFVTSRNGLYATLGVEAEFE